MPARRWTVPLAALLAAGAAALALSARAEEGPALAPGAPPKTAELDLFFDWPRDAKPELALVLSGQMYGYLQPCGCSRPQLGGLERRYNFIEALQADRGWSVLPLDLGDISAKKGLHKQRLLKHQVTMKALDRMGYAALGVGVADYQMPLLDALANFTLQKGDAPPFLLAGNLANRGVLYPGVKPDRPMVGRWEVVAQEGRPAVGVVGVIGSDTATDIKSADAQAQFEDNAAVLRKALSDMAAHAPRPDIHVLLYQGGLAGAKKAAEAFPEFHVVLAKSDEEEPPTFPVIVSKEGEPKRMLVSVGHKGRHVGVVGVFRTGDQLDLRYHLASLGEKYETPDAKAAGHPVLAEFQAYTQKLKDEQFLKQYPKTAHPVQVKHPKAAFVGSHACAACHAEDYAVWQNSKHAVAYKALEKATRPSLRNFDGECVVCHTVGFAHNTGFVDRETTPLLKGVGCENCHGPGSLHAAEPKNAAYHIDLSPWKLMGKGHLPTPDKMLSGGDMTPDERRTLLRVDATCQGCHDTDNDPHFRLEAPKYWPKIVHGKKPGAAR